MYLRNLFFLISRLDPIHNTKSQSSLSVRSRNFCCPILKYAAASSKVKFAFSQKGISFILRTHLSDSCKSHVSSPFDLLSHIFNTQITESLSFSFLLDFDRRSLKIIGECVSIIKLSLFYIKTEAAPSHRSFTSAHSDGLPSNSVTSSRREYHYQQ